MQDSFDNTLKQCEATVTKHASLNCYYNASCDATVASYVDATVASYVDALYKNIRIKSIAKLGSPLSFSFLHSDFELMQQVSKIDLTEMMAKSQLDSFKPFGHSFTGRFDFSPFDLLTYAHNKAPDGGFAFTTRDVDYTANIQAYEALFTDFAIYNTLNELLSDDFAMFENEDNCSPHGLNFIEYAQENILGAARELLLARYGAREDGTFLAQPFFARIKDSYKAGKSSILNFAKVCIKRECLEIMQNRDDSGRYLTSFWDAVNRKFKHEGIVFNGYINDRFDSFYSPQLLLTQPDKYRCRIAIDVPWLLIRKFMAAHDMCFTEEYKRFALDGDRDMRLNVFLLKSWANKDAVNSWRELTKVLQTPSIAKLGANHVPV